MQAVYGDHMLDVAKTFNSIVTYFASRAFCLEPRMPSLRVHPLVYLMHTFTELCLVDAHRAESDTGEIPVQIPFVQAGRLNTVGILSQQASHSRPTPFDTHLTPIGHPHIDTESYNVCVWD